MKTKFLLTAMAVLGLAFLPTPARTQERPKPYQNLQVLPKDISRDDLGKVMLANLRGLGLPRRQREGCLFCHVGDMEKPVGTWDFASDAKPEKIKARTMMAMVLDINERHLKGLTDRHDPAIKVTCSTCHAGRTSPLPLFETLFNSYREDGIDGAIAKYRELRGRYFGADAYDFRVGTLIGVANRIAARGSFEDALALAAVNDEVFPDDPTARQAVVFLKLRRATQVSGISAGLAEFDRIKAEEKATVMTFELLDRLGWGLFRRDRQQDALTVFRKNLAEFPDEYITNESLADALWFSDDHPSAIRRLEAWLTRYPDHKMARRRLTNMKAQLEKD